MIDRNYRIQWSKDGKEWNDGRVNLTAQEAWYQYQQEKRVHNDWHIRVVDKDNTTMVEFIPMSERS